MTTIHEIQQAMYVETPHGEGMPLFLIDYGPHLNSIWVVANCEDGKIRHYDSSDINLTVNWTLHFNDKRGDSDVHEKH
jgi:hypothetical protein